MACFNINQEATKDYPQILNLPGALLSSVITHWQGVNKTDSIPSVEVVWKHWVNNSTSEKNGVDKFNIDEQFQLFDELGNGKNQDPTKYFQGTKQTTSSTVLRLISQSNHPLAKLAKQLLPLNRNVKVILGNEEQLKTMRASAMYDGNLDVIYINPKGNVKYSIEATLIHEIIHALTIKTLATNPDARKRLDKYYEQLQKSEPAFRDKYPFKNLEEFITGIFTNPHFQEDLKALDNREWWEKVIDLISSLFGGKHSDLYKKVMDAGWSVIEDTPGFYIKPGEYDQVYFADEASDLQNQIIKNFDLLQSKVTKVEGNYSVDGLKVIWNKAFNKDNTKYSTKLKTETEKNKDEAQHKINSFVQGMQFEVIRKAFPEANAHLTPLQITSENASVYQAIEDTLKELIADAKKEGTILKAGVFVADTRTKQNGQVDILGITIKGNYKTYSLKTNFKEFGGAVQKLERLQQYSKEQEIANEILSKGDPSIGIPAGIIEDSKVIKSIVKTDKKGTVSEINNTTVIAPQFLRTADRKLNNLIDALNNQIKNLSDTKTPNPIEQAAINELLESKLELVQKLQLKQDIDALLVDSGNDLIYIDNLIQENEKDQILKESSTIKESLALYSQLASFIDENDLPIKLQDKLLLIEAKALKLQRKFANLKKDVIETNAEFTGVKTLGKEAGFGDNIFAAVKDIGAFTKWVMGTSNIPNPLVATGYRLMTTTQAKIRQKMQLLGIKLQEAIDEYKKYTNSESYDLLLQVNKLGKFTGNLVDKFSHEFYSERSKAVLTSDVNWFNNNVDYNKEDYEKEYEKKESFLDAYSKTDKDKIKARLIEAGMSEGILFNEKVEEEYIQYRKAALDAWVKEHKNNKGQHYIPKSKWIDPKWKTIKEGEYKGTPVEKFYDLHKSYIEMAAEISPEYINSNFIANFTQDILQKYAELGLVGTIKASWSGLLNNLHVGKDENEYGKIDSFTGETVSSLFIPGISKIDNKSLDLGKNLFMFMEGIYRYQEMSAIEDTILAIKDEIKNAKYIKTNVLGNEVKGAGGAETKLNSNTAEQFNAYVDAELYGKKRELDKGFELKGNGFTSTLGLLDKGDSVKISYAKIVDKLLHYTMLRNLVFNMYAPVVNTLSGTSMMYMTGAGGVDYSTKNLNWAIGLTTMGKTGVNNPDAIKANLIMEWLGLEANEFVKEKSAEFSSSRLKKYINKYNGLTFMRGSENVMHETGALAMLKSGNHSYNWEDFEVINGKLVDKKNGSFLDIEKFRQKVIKVNARNLGNMNQDDFVLAKRYILGRMLMQHRNWLPSLLVERWGGKRFDYVLEREMQGRYLAASRVIKEAILHGNFKNLTDYEKEAVKSAMAEAGIIAMIGLLLMALGAVDDDKKKQAWYKYTHKINQRVLGELYFFADPTFTSQYQIILSPAASISTIQAWSRLVKDTWREGMADVLYDDPRHVKKMAKPLKRLGAVIPPIGQISRLIDDLYDISAK